MLTLDFLPFYFRNKNRLSPFAAAANFDLYSIKMEIIADFAFLITFRSSKCLACEMVIWLLWESRICRKILWMIREQVESTKSIFRIYIWDAETFSLQPTSQNPYFQWQNIGVLILGISKESFSAPLHIYEKNANED